VPDINERVARVESFFSDGTTSAERDALVRQTGARAVLVDDTYRPVGAAVAAYLAARTTLVASANGLRLLRIND
jgi:hypothetical protein